MLGRSDPTCRAEIELTPAVMERRKAKKSNRGDDQSGSHDTIRSVLHRMMGSALPRSAMRTSTSGADSRAPLTIRSRFG